jgi:hypothetical protein
MEKAYGAPGLQLESLCGGFWLNQHKWRKPGVRMRIFGLEIPGVNRYI